MISKRMYSRFEQGWHDSSFQYYDNSITYQIVIEKIYFIKIIQVGYCDLNNIFYEFE